MLEKIGEYFQYDDVHALHDGVVTPQSRKEATIRARPATTARSTRQQNTHWPQSRAKVQQMLEAPRLKVHTWSLKP